MRGQKDSQCVSSAHTAALAGSQYDTPQAEIFSLIQKVLPWFYGPPLGISFAWIKIPGEARSRLQLQVGGKDLGLHCSPYLS